jgi:hypothetical protein
MEQGSKPVCEDRAEAEEREEYKSITISATAAGRLWHLYLFLNHSTISLKDQNNPFLFSPDPIKYVILHSLEETGSKCRANTLRHG